MFLLILSVNAQEVDKPFVSNGELLFYLDNSAFLGSEGKTYIEFYMMLYADQLKPVMKDGNSIAITEIQVIIKNEKNEIIDQKDWTTEVSYINPGEASSLAVYDLWGCFVTHGNYELFMTITDAETKRKGEIRTTLAIPELESHDLRISQISFINGLNESAQKIGDRKNSIIPNPSRRFGLLNPNLTFYYEMYIPYKLSSENLKAEYLIKDTKGNLIKSLNDIEIKALSKTKRITQAINVAKINTGIYTLELLIKNSSGVQVASANRNFEIIQPDYFSEKTMDIQEKLSVLENILSYISTSQQLNIYKNLEPAGKVSFLVRFFRDLDPAPETINNEYLEGLIERYNISNQKFNWGVVAGWKTERARVLIQYGKPDEIENFSFEEDSRPYEIWYYRKDRELFFVFADMLSNGNYILLHSDKEGEIYNPMWKELITKL